VRSCGRGEMQFDDRILVAKLPNNRRRGPMAESTAHQTMKWIQTSRRAAPYRAYLEEAQADAEKSQADVSILSAAHCFAGDMRGSEMSAEVRKMEKPDRNIDKESSATIVVGEPAAAWSDDRRNDDAHAIDGHWPCLVFRAESFRRG